jgi:transcriptional regulator with XRE-family HTH domain
MLTKAYAIRGDRAATFAHGDAICAPIGLPSPPMFASVAVMKHQGRAIRLILGEARNALHMSQREFGYAVGASHRTASRWDGGKASPGVHHLHVLARLLHPHDRTLAAEVADAADETLESLGLEIPPAPPPPAPLALPAPKARPEDLVDLLVLTAVEQTGSSPAAVRPWLHAVVKRGAELGLTMEVAEQALRPPAPEKAAGKDRKVQK